MIFSFIVTTFFPSKLKTTKAWSKYYLICIQSWTTAAVVHDPIEEGIIVFQSIKKVYIFVIEGALTNTIVLQFVQKLKKIDHGRQSRQFVT